MSIDERLRQLGIRLPPPSGPAANYGNCVRTGNLLFVSGKAPLRQDAAPPKGKLGREYSTRDGYAFARLAALDILAVVAQELGSLDRVRRVVKLQGFVNATPEFEEHPQVMNGASDLMIEVFEERGLHARSALGATSLRAGLPVVIDSIFEVE